ncbi:hypothetical protein PISMIDRAFT_448474 [Pisolithus microcarpus 441]|uniref:Uncharacterized protein n=1 Tax=Pisolithus microcarpus 441 TaxID=765257 RepID=A0A0C9YY46_9AGAM|nr:hypothetical protein PISMIDRAFT_448474 [Pisolithus microcarpus 441]
MDSIGAGLTSRQSANYDHSSCSAFSNGREEHLITSPTLAQTEALRDDGSPQPVVPPSTQKKKKKKKSKKASTKDGSSSATVQPQVDNLTDAERPPVLCISRNKHWKYISSYHGPWLQLPLELLESLLVLNLDPGTMSPSEGQFLSSQPAQNGCAPKRPSCFRSPPRLDEFDRGFRSLSDYTPPESPGGTFTSLSPLQTLHPSPPAFPLPVAGRPTPPPIDPGVFRNVAAIRRLIDEAAELSVRASSGLSAAALGSMRNGGGNASWATAHALGLDGTGNVGGGRNVAMSAMRIHRLRALAVQKLAAAYKADEVASSVMVMQGGSVFDDIAERVLKHDPNDPDARYVHFFHEKIPSRSANRQLAESTTTQVLDELIAAYPQRLEYFRTRGIVHCFRDEYMLAVKDFTHALKEARSVRKGRTAHRTIISPTEPRGKSSKQKKGSNKSHGRAPPNGTSPSADAFSIDGVEPLLHSSVLPDAPDPIEPQLLFLRGAAYLQQAVYLIESAILKLEGIGKSISAVDGAELRLCYLANGRYGGVEVGNPDGPLGKSDGPKACAYRQVLADAALRNEIDSHLRKCIRDHERFLSHFDTIGGPSPVPTTDSPAELARRVELAFRLTEIVRPGNHSAASRPPVADSTFPLPFTTYHPLIVESHFNILICQLMLGELATLVTTFARTAVIVEGLEGYPVFLPPRSMAQAEFIEVLERLAAGWRVGVLPHSATQADSLRSRAEIEAPPRSPPMCLVEEMSFNAEGNDPSFPVASSSTKGIVTPSPRSLERDTPTPCSFSESHRIDLVEALECARMLLATVARRQKERTSKVAADKASNGNKKPLNINIPLHGPRVEIILAWFAAVHLVDLESVA